MDAALSRPRFRTDLVAQPIEESGQRFIDVTDPDSGTTFRFYEVEYSIACAMDGQRSVPALADWAEAELGIAPRPSSDELERVISTLSELGYLTSQSSLAADIGLGHAGTPDTKETLDYLPSAPDLELGFAGNEASDLRGPEMPQAADIGLGHAGNEGMGAPALLDVNGGATVEEVDEDEPTKMLERRPPSDRSAVDLPPPPPPGGDIEPQAVLRPTTNADSDEDGPTALPAPASEFEDEVSVDLTDHLKLGPDALKEAVRQSKMIPAVEPPAVPGIKDSAPPPPPPAPPVPATPVPPPTELPDKPAISVSKTTEASTPTGEKSSKVGLLVVVVILLLLVGAAAFEFFTNTFGVRGMLGLDEKAEPAKPEPKPEPVVKKPPPPKPPTAALTAVEVPVQQVAAPKDGVLAFVAEAGAEVEEGAELAKFKGFERIESKIRETQGRQEVYQKRLEKAQAADNDREVTRNQAKVDEKREAVAELQKELEAFVLAAPIAGVVDSPLPANSKVKAEQPIMGIKVPPTLQATFAMPDGLTYEEAAEVEVTAGDKTLACKVIGVDGGNVKIDCPSGGDIATDTEVTLPLPAKK